MRKKRATENIVNLSTNHLSNKGKYILLLSILLISLYVFKDFILLKNLYLFKDIGSDSINSSYPQLIHISEYLRSEGIPKWSFSQGMGQNIFPFSLGNPFDLILYLLPSKYLAYGIVYVEILKIIIGGLFYYLYLRTIELTEYASIIGGMLFSFSGFMILGGGWYTFSTEAVYAALLLYSFERFFKYGSWHLFPIAIALISAFQPFNVYLYGLFLLLYMLFRYPVTNEGRLKGMHKLLLKVTGLGLLGLSMSSFFLFNNLLQMMESPRIGGDASYSNALLSTPVFSIEGIEHNITAVMRFFSNDLLGTGSYFKGSYNYLEAPIFYIGLVNLILAPQIFIHLNRRRKIYYALFAVAFVLPIIFPFFRCAFWLFTGNYYRGFSFFVALIFLLYSIQALSNIDKTFKLNKLLLIATVIILMGFLFFPYAPQINSRINKELRDIVAIFLVVYAMLIYLMSLNKYKTVLQVILFITILTELSYFSSITVNNRFIISSEEYERKVGYNDFTVDALSYLNSSDKSFFRVIKYYSSGPTINASTTETNDAKVQNFKGTSSYYSFNQKNYIQFLEELNIISRGNELETRWANGLSGRLLLQPLASVKYILAKGDASSFLSSDRYEYVSQFGDVKVFKDRYYLPLGYTYDRFLTISYFRPLLPAQKDAALLNAFVVDDREIEKYKQLQQFDLNAFITSNYTIKEYEDSIENRRSEVLVISEHSHNHIKGKVNLSGDKLLFFSIPFDKGWHAKVDGKEVKLEQVNIGFMGLLLIKGTHTIELEYEPPYLITGAIISLLSIGVYAFIFKKCAKFI